MNNVQIKGDNNKMLIKQESKSFEFESEDVRVVKDENGEPWFVANDVCNVLQISNTSQAIQSLCDDEKDKCEILTPDGEQSLIIINESGLYALMLYSNRKEARDFRNWITSEVLPHIIRGGQYDTEYAPYLSIMIFCAIYTMNNPGKSCVVSEEKFQFALNGSYATF